MISFLKLIRYKNLLMILLTLVLTKYFLIESFTSNSSLPFFDFILLLISILTITAAGYIINDVFDIETDKINKPKKVFIGKTISKKDAFYYYYSLNFIGLFVGLYLSISNKIIVSYLIFIITAILLYAYSKKLKKIAIIGNLIISLLIALTIITLYIFEVNTNETSTSFLTALKSLCDSISLTLIIFSYTFFAFIITFIREMVKDIEDINGDYASGMKTLPIILGIDRCKKILFLISSCCFLFLVFILKEIKHFLPLLICTATFVLLPFAYYLYKLWIANTKKQYHQLSQLLKMIMFFGILSMLFFKFQ